jgi:hypothetical protein
MELGVLSAWTAFSRQGGKEGEVFSFSRGEKKSKSRYHSACLYTQWFLFSHEFFVKLLATTTAMEVFLGALISH